MTAYNPAFIVETVLFELITLSAFLGFCNEYRLERQRSFGNSTRTSTVSVNRTVRVSQNAWNESKTAASPAGGSRARAASAPADGKVDRLIRRAGAVGSFFLVLAWIDARGIYGIYDTALQYVFCNMCATFIIALYYGVSFCTAEALSAIVNVKPPQFMAPLMVVLTVLTACLGIASSICMQELDMLYPQALLVWWTALQVLIFGIWWMWSFINLRDAVLRYQISRGTTSDAANQLRRFVTFTKIAFVLACIGIFGAGYAGSGNLSTDPIRKEQPDANYLDDPTYCLVIQVFSIGYALCLWFTRKPRDAAQSNASASAAAAASYNDQASVLIVSAGTGPHIELSHNAASTASKRAPLSPPAPSNGRPARTSPLLKPAREADVLTSGAVVAVASPTAGITAPTEAVLAIEASAPLLEVDQRVSTE